MNKQNTLSQARQNGAAAPNAYTTKTARVWTAAAYNQAAAANDANPPAVGVTEGPVSDITQAGSCKWGGWGWRYRAEGRAGYTYWTGRGAEKAARAHAAWMDEVKK